MKKSTLLFPVFLILSFLCAEGKGESKNPSPAPPPTAMILTYMDGVVLIDGIPAELGQTIPAGSTVTTGEDGYCEVVFGGQNIFRIEPDTITILYIGPGTGRIDLNKGSLALLLDKLDVLGLGSGAFTFNTPVSSAAIRGTAFYVKVESPESTYFCCCYGTIDLTDIGGSNPVTLSTAHHHAVRYRGNGEGYSFADAPLLYHDDREMDELAHRVDLSIPWSGSAYSY